MKELFSNAKQARNDRQKAKAIVNLLRTEKIVRSRLVWIIKSVVSITAVNAFHINLIGKTSI